MTRNQKDIKKIAGKLSFYIAVILIAFLCFFPVIWIFLTSIKTTREIYAFPLVYIPREPTLKNYIEVFLGSDFGRYLVNSLIVSSLATLLAIIPGSIASYSLARLRFKGRRTTLLSILGLSMFPPIAIVPSLFLFFRVIGFVNTYQGLILAHSALYSPMAVWILTNYFKTVPMDLEDAARIDGCTFLAIIPLVVFTLFFQKYIVGGLTAGAIKS